MRGSSDTLEDIELKNLRDDLLKKHSEKLKDFPEEQRDAYKTLYADGVLDFYNALIKK